MIQHGIRPALCVLAAASWLASSVTAQTPPQLPYNKGQWAGPYYRDFTEAGVHPLTHEIVHAVVLPPPAATPDECRILLWNRINTSCVNGCAPENTNGSYGRFFVLRPDSRFSIETISLADTNPLYDDDQGSMSPFCGGQTLLADGSLLITGGTDRINQCIENNCDTSLGVPGFGHDLVARLDTSIDPPVWDAIDWNNQMTREHWYGNSITLENGTVLVAGHAGDPAGYDIFRESIPYDLSTGIGTITTTVNFSPELTGPGVAYDCQQTPNLPMGDYPRMHMLMSGDLMEVMGTFRNPGTGGIEPRTRFMDRIAPYECTVNDWLEAVDQPDTLRFGGNSVHLITLDDQGAPGSRIEVVYSIGGGDTGNEAGCDSTYGITDSVERMVDPGPGQSWEAVADLKNARMNHNAVLLLDGSILAVGGEANDGQGGPCEPVLMAERHRPEEVFDTVAPGWNIMKEQAIGRGYHSTAVMLPDGRVLIAGGVGPDSTPSSSRHTFEVYSPPYVFALRPEVTSVPSTPITWGDSIFVTTELAGSGTAQEVARVALLRAGAATHAWDSNQRYVELEFEIFGGTWDNQTLEVEIPAVGSGEYILPPGDYLLTVIDASNKPSPGEWVRIN